MGFFDSLKSFAGRVYGAVGSAVKTFSEFASPVLKKFGELAAPIGDYIGFALDTAANASGNPEFEMLADGVRQGGNMISNLANKAYDLTSNIAGLNRSRPAVVDLGNAYNFNRDTD